MKNEMYVTDYYGNKIKVYPLIASYYNHNLAIRLWTDDGEPWASLTVNLDVNLHDELGEEYALVDVNNFPEAEEFIAKYGIGEPMNASKTSGYVRYPLYKFDLKKLKEY